MDKKLIKIYEAFSERLQKHQLPHWNDLPEIDLYMDQVIVLTEKYLKDLTIDGDDKPITPSMINNYVKLDIIPPPVKKKYSREHIAYLIIICSLKQVMPIPKIKELIDFKLKTCTIDTILNNFSDLYQKTFKGVVDICNSFLESDDSKSNIDGSLFLAIAASHSIYISDKILKLEKKENNKN